MNVMTHSQNTGKLRNLWFLGICIHILTFLFVLDLYFTSPIKHGMTPHRSNGEAFAKRVVVFIVDGLRAEAIYPKDNWQRTEYLSDLRLNGSCSWGIVHTGVPTESRPGHVAIFAGLMEDPSAIFTGWQANTVQFDSVINESNYVWSYGSPDIVRIFTKKDKARLHVDCYNPDQEDFSGRTSTINLDKWVFDHVEELLTPKGNSCEAQMIRRRTQRRRMQELNLRLAKERARCQAEMTNCEGKYYECYKKMKPCLDDITERQYQGTLQEANLNLEAIELYPCVDDFNELGCEQLCQDGNVFFLHLLGMDTAGHVHKPDSREYIENLRAVDVGIREIEHLFHDFFNDNATAFLFTADHGMTNWGSHGDGSAHETEVPYILWGRGVRDTRLRQDLKQTDLAPLISSLLGTPIPVNSVGVLPHWLLNGTHAQIAHAVLANVMQHVEQYKLLLGEFDADPLFAEYPLFRDDYVDASVSTMRRLLAAGDKEKLVVRLGEELMKDILAANQYMRNYYFVPKVAAVMFGFILWIVYLSLSIHVRDGTKHLGSGRGMRSCRPVTRYLLIVALVVVVCYLKGVEVKCFTYAYPAFLIGLLALFSEDTDVVDQLWILCDPRNRTKFVARTAIYAILVQLLVFGFFNRLFCAGVVLILAFWLTQNHRAVQCKVRWFTVSAALAALQVVAPSTKFNYYGLAIGSLLWIAIYFAFVYAEGRDYIKRFDLKYKAATRNIILAPLVGYVVGAANALYVAYAFNSGAGVSDVNLCVSWAVAAASLLLIPAAPTGALARFGHIAASLVVPYALMAVNIDLIFYSVLAVTLYYWMEIEATMSAPATASNPLRQMHFTVNYAPTGSVNVSALYRRTYFYLALTVCYFFAIGNMASFNGFDPQWTRAFVATFNPTLMAALIVVKMVIPFFLITCAFYAIVLHARACDRTVFTILLLFLDQMVLNFMLCVRNEGSWLEVGRSLSHFAVMEAMALVMLVFFALARFVCSFRMGDAETGGGGAPDASDANVAAALEEGVRRRHQSTIKQARAYSSVKSSWSTSSLSALTCPTLPSSLFSHYMNATPNSSEGGTLASIPSMCAEIGTRSQEVQCKFEDETLGGSSSMRATPSKSTTYSATVPEESRDALALKRVEEMFAGTKKDVFKVAFDLGIVATLQHCQERSLGGDDSSGVTSRSSRRRRGRLEAKDAEAIEPDTSENSERVGFVDKAGESGHCVEPQMVPPGIAVRTYNFLRNYETNIDWEPMIPRRPVYDLTYYDIFPTVDRVQAKKLRVLHLQPFAARDGYLNISTRFSRGAHKENTGMISHPSYDDVDCHFYSAVYAGSQSDASAVRRGPALQVSFFATGRSKQDLRRRKSAPHLATVATRVASKTASAHDLHSRLQFAARSQRDHHNAADDMRENGLEKQLEVANLSKAVQSSLQPGMRVASKVSVIRTESYFRAGEQGPAGSRAFRGARTCFGAADVLRLAPSLSQEEARYHFMDGTRAKTPHEQTLINSHLKQVARASGACGSSTTTASSASPAQCVDRFELRHKEAVRSEKRRRREHRRRMRELLADAGQRAREQLEQEAVRRAERERGIASERRSFARLVPSQAVFNLLQTDDCDEPMKLVLPEENRNATSAAANSKQSHGEDVRALVAFADVAQVIVSEAMRMVPEHDSEHRPFRQTHQDGGPPRTRSPLIAAPVKRKVRIEPDTSSESEAEMGEARDKRQKRRKLKEHRLSKEGGAGSSASVSRAQPPKGVRQRNSEPAVAPSSSDAPANTRASTPAPPAASQDSEVRPPSSPRSGARNEVAARGSACRDRYDKACCVRKRPSAKFISNAHEMALKLSRALGGSDRSEASIRVARLPIRVAPGILCAGRTRPKSPTASMRTAGLLQRPTEEMITEERELEQCAPSPRASRRRSQPLRHFLRSAPTLLTLNTTSTLVNDAEVAEGRLSLAVASSAEGDDPAPRPNRSWAQLESISERYVQLRANLSTESMPDSMKLAARANDSDPSSIFSDLPEDPGAPLINFEGVTTSLRSARAHEERPNTCYDVFTLAKQLSVEPEKDVAGAGHPEERMGSEGMRTPRFYQDDPSKYLVKVESWLRNIELQPVAHANEASGGAELDAESASSNSTITSADLVEDADVEAGVHAPVAREIAKRLMAAGFRYHGDRAVRDVDEAYRTVSFVLHRTRDIVGGSVDSASLTRTSTETQTMACSMFTTGSSTSVGTDAPAAVSVGVDTQTAAKYPGRGGGRGRCKSKLTQCTVPSADAQAMTESCAEKVTSSVGIQHSFTEIAVNTDQLVLGHISTQVEVTLVDIQVGTMTPRVAERRDIGVSPMMSDAQKGFGARWLARAGETVSATPVCLDTSRSPDGDKDGSPPARSRRLGVPLRARTCGPRTCGETSPLPAALRTQPDLTYRRRLTQRDGRPNDESAVTSRYESPPKSPMTESPPSFVPALQLPSPSPTPSCANTPTTSEGVITKNAKTRCLPRKLPAKKAPISHTPKTLDRPMSTFARIEGRKSYTPALQQIAALGGIANPRPKVTSVPRTDFAELPDTHEETGAMVTPASISMFPASTASVLNSTVRRQRPPAISGATTNAVLEGTNMVTTWKHFTTVIKRWRRQGMTEEEICKEIERQKFSRPTQ